jgi:hypothetical protein
VAVWPAFTVWFAGCVVMVGPCGAAWFTVSIALLLAALPAELVTVTEKADPLSAVVVAGVVYELDVAPLMFVPFFFH